MLNEERWLASHGTFQAKLLVLEVNDKDLDQPFVNRDILDTNPSFPSHHPISGVSEIMTRYVMPRLGLTNSAADPGSTNGTFQRQDADNAMASVENIKRFALSRGSAMMILYWDTKLPLSAQAIDARESLFNQAANSGIEIIRPHLMENSCYRDKVHPNVEGNIAISEKLASNMSKSGILQQIK